MVDQSRPPRSGSPSHSSSEAMPLGGTRAEAIQRLQVGFSLLVGIVLLVGIANVIENRAKEVEATTVPEAAATVPAVKPTLQSDPLADAGVVPDLPIETPTPFPLPSLTPEPTDTP